MQAAALAHGIAESQTFIDGNKRLALIAMLAFLEINGFEIEASDPELAAWIVSLSAAATPKELAKLIRARLRPISPRSSASCTTSSTAGSPPNPPSTTRASTRTVPARA